MILIRLTEEWFPRLVELDTTLERAAAYRLQDGLLHLQDQGAPEQGVSESDLEPMCTQLQHLNQSGGLVMGAQASGRLVALAAMSGVVPEHGPAWRTLRHCYTDRQWRCKGLGSALLRALSREAAREGAEQLFIPSLPAADTVDFWLRRRASLMPPDQTAPSFRIPGTIPLKLALANI
ncbi:MAG: GNAT family N-acetyltransferase [Bacteroidetes bacterium]|nr:GNAT family N-acetyltransferase [Bacteroidota bacterium]